MNSVPYTLTGSERLVNYISANQESIQSALDQHGAVLLRGFKIFSMSEFQQASELICKNLFDYVYRSSPRTKLGGKVYTSTEFPKDREIPLHNENSYSLNWPSKILFHCVIEPPVAGETPIAHSGRVYSLLDPALREEFERKKVMYVRNYGLGMDLTWQEAFQTESKEEVEAFCKSHQINVEWFGENRLRTRQICQASLKHPRTGEMLWFNQAHLFHESANDDQMREYFCKNFKADEMPRNTFYGDGSPINEETLNHIRAAYKQVEVAFPWRKGDMLILDNLLYAHGRRPFEGDRKIVVAMGD